MCFLAVSLNFFRTALSFFFCSLIIREVLRGVSSVEVGCDVMGNDAWLSRSVCIKDEKLELWTAETEPCGFCLLK